MTEFGVGIVGMGFMGKTHAYAHRTLPFYYADLPYKTRLVTACNRSPAAAEYAKERLGFEKATTNFEDILEDPAIQLVHICTPNEFHYSQVKAALAAGKHVYCDKPLTVTYAEAAELALLAEKSGLTAQVAFQNRFFPATIRAKELIDEGKIGDVLCFRTEYLHSGALNAEKPIGWKQGESAGVLRDMGSHAIDLISWLTGKFTSVYANSIILYPQRPDKNGNLVDVTMEDHATLLVTLPSGGTGVIEASKMSTGIDDELRFEIHGSRGALRFNLMQPNTLWFYDATKPETVYGGERGFCAIECTARYPAPAGFPSQKNAVGWIRAHCHSLYKFVDNVYRGLPGDPSFEDGAYVQYIMEKACESIANKAQIKL